jgi:hypothetical protein
MRPVATRVLGYAKENVMPTRRPNPLPAVPRPETPGLLRLVHDLLEHREVRMRFNTSPARLAKDYGLKPSEEAALFSMDGDKIGLELGVQLRQINYAFMEKEFPILSPEFTDDPAAATPEYPSPKPQIFRISPARVSLAAGKFEFHVFGQSFSHDAEIELKHASGSQPLAITKQRVFGTFRCSRAYGLVQPPSTPGEYVVTVVNSPGSSQKTPVQSPSKLVVEA